MPWTSRRVSRPDEHAHRGRSLRGRSPGCRDGLFRGVVERGRRREVRLFEQDRGLGGVRADDSDDHRDVALLDGACIDEPAGHLVAAGDAAEDVDQDRVDLRVGQDDPHRRRDLVGARPTADVEEVGRLAAGPLDEVHGRHRQAGAVDHAADRAVELDERQARLARLAIGGILLVGIAQLLEPGVAGECRVVERDLGVEADQALDACAVGAGLADDRQRVDLDQVRVVGEHRPDEALGDGDCGFQVTAETHREGELACLVVEQAEERVGVVADDRLRVVDRDLLDLDAALGRAHQQDAPLGAIEDRGHVELAGDVGCSGHQDLADRDALDVHAEDGRRDLLGLVGAGGKLHAAGLAAPADEDLGLDDDRAGTARQDPLGGGTRLGDGVGDLPVGYGQALRDEQGLCVGFLDLHEGDGSAGRVGVGERWYRVAPSLGRFRNESAVSPRHTR